MLLALGIVCILLSFVPFFKKKYYENMMSIFMIFLSSLFFWIDHGGTFYGEFEKGKYLFGIFFLATLLSFLEIFSANNKSSFLLRLNREGLFHLGVATFFLSVFSLLQISFNTHVLLLFCYMFLSYRFLDRSSRFLVSLLIGSFFLQELYEGFYHLSSGNINSTVDMTFLFLNVSRVAFLFLLTLLSFNKYLDTNNVSNLNPLWPYLLVLFSRGIREGTLLESYFFIPFFLLFLWSFFFNERRKEVIFYFNILYFLIFVKVDLAILFLVVISISKLKEILEHAFKYYQINFSLTSFSYLQRYFLTIGGILLLVKVKSWDLRILVMISMILLLGQINDRELDFKIK